MKQAIDLREVTKRYKDFTLGPINLSIPRGTIIGLIGENGAGKTTLIKCILNAMQYEGKVDMPASHHIGAVLDDSFFPELLTVGDIEKIMKASYSTFDDSLFKQYLDTFKLPTKRSIKTFSKGMHKKLEIAVALSHHPNLLILDEPTSGLDPIIRTEILDIFLEFMQDENHTILFSTHITSDLEHIADYIVFMDKGRILLEEEKDVLLENYGIIKCDPNTFKSLPKEDYETSLQNKYGYELLTKNRLSFKNRKDIIVDKANLEDIMVAYIKGVRK